MHAMLGRIVSMIVTFPETFLGILVDLLEKICGPNGHEWIRELKKFLRKEPCWIQSQDAEVAEMKPAIYICRTKVNRIRTPKEAIDATGRFQYTNHKVVQGMPRGEGNEVDVVVFNLEAWEYTKPGFISEDDLEKAYNRRGLKNDPMALVAANEDDLSLADKMPHGTHWKDANGYWCCITFDISGGERGVGVYRDGRGWDGRWFFAGSREVIPQN